MYVVPLNQTFHVDVFVLKDLALNSSHNDTSLRSLFDSDKVVKVFFDVRGGSDAPFYHYGVVRHNTVDLQTMAYFQLTQSPGRGLKSLASCIDQDAGLPDHLVTDWISVKDAGEALFASADPILSQRRPLSSRLIQYSVGNVEHMAILYSIYKVHLRSEDWQDVFDEIEARIRRPFRRRERGPSKQQRRSVPKKVAATGKGEKQGELQVQQPSQLPLYELISRMAIHSSGPAESEIHHTSAPVGVNEPDQDLLRHLPLRFVAESKTARSKETIKRRQVTRMSQPRSRRYEEDSDHSLCDKNRGWCGHCPRSMSICEL